jgi:hypothetical protein
MITKTSIGIILVKTGSINYPPEVLLVHKRYTYAFHEFVNGNYIYLHHNNAKSFIKKTYVDQHYFRVNSSNNKMFEDGVILDIKVIPGDGDPRDITYEYTVKKNDDSEIIIKNRSHYFKIVNKTGGYRNTRRNYRNQRKSTKRCR